MNRTRRPTSASRAALSVVASVLLLAPAACGPGEEDRASGAADPSADAPGLVALVVIDQLRPDLIERYEAHYTGGFRRLLDEGHAFTQASHAHAWTETAPGHATLATGVVPARHGIVANSWYRGEGEDLSELYAVEDTASPVLGYPDMEGRGPVSLMQPGLGEWLTAARPDARVLALSKKDRAAITLAGRVPGAHVYWIAGDEGRFVTSAYYRDAYPEWVEAFNARAEGGMPDLFDDSVWTSQVPPEARPLSRPDTFPMEGRYGFTAFPHRGWREAEVISPAGVRDWIAETPVADEAVLRLAREGVRALELGRREGVTDYLALSFSAVDYVGHDYGPFSREQLDNLLRLDRVLGELFGLLDDEVGEGRWVLAFTADHGVLDYPEYRRERGLSGVRPTREQVRALHERVRAAGGMEELARIVAESPLLETVYGHGRIAAGDTGEPADSLMPLYRNNLVEGRWPEWWSARGFELVPAEGALWDHWDGGTTHGSPYWYDRWVPLYLVGPGVPPGRSEEPAFTYDVAPTLAELAGIAAPDGLDGRPLMAR